jgi:hypothetical protein
LGSGPRCGSPARLGGVIRDLDATLAGWLGSLLPGTTISFEPPGTVEPPSAKAAKGGVLSLFLDDVRMDSDASDAGWASLRGEDGVVVGRVPPTRRYRFAYILVAQAADALAEHDLLGRVMSGAALHEVVPAEHLAGDLAHAEGSVLVRCAPPKRWADPEHLWRAWGVAPRATLELSVLAPLLMPYIMDVAQPPSRLDLGTSSSRTGHADGANGQEAAQRPRLTHRIQEG